MSNENKINELIAELAMLVNNKETVTLEEYVSTEYLPYLSNIPAKKKINLKKDKYLINIILSYPIAKIKMNEVNCNDILIFFSTLEKDRGITKATRNRYRERLNAIYNHAIHCKYIKDNPVKYIGKSYEMPRGRYLSENEIHRLLEECSNSRNKELYTIVLIALHTGARASEILNMTLNNIQNRYIVFNSKETKTGLPRKIPMSDILNTHINNYIKDNVFISGNLFKSINIRAAFDFAKSRAGIEEFRFHDLRRTFATFLKDKDVNVHTISKLLGHTNLMTTERYLGFDDNKLLDSVQKIKFI